MRGLSARLVPNGTQPRLTSTQPPPVNCERRDHVIAGATRGIAHVVDQDLPCRIVAARGVTCW